MLKFNSENWGLTFNSGSFVLGNDREDTSNIKKEWKSKIKESSEKNYEIKMVE